MATEPDGCEGLAVAGEKARIPSGVRQLYAHAVISKGPTSGKLSTPYALQASLSESMDSIGFSFRKPSHQGGMRREQRLARRFPMRSANGPWHVTATSVSQLSW